MASVPPRWTRKKRFGQIKQPGQRGPRLHLRLDLGFQNALRKRAELAAQGLADADAPISLGPSSNLQDYPDNLPEQ